MVFSSSSLRSNHLCTYINLFCTSAQSFHNEYLCFFWQLKTISAQVDERPNILDSESESDDDDALKKATEQLKVSDMLLLTSFSLVV